MPIHDWTRVDSGTFHDFHQDWTIELKRQLNRGILPPGYVAMADQRVSGPVPDVVTFQSRLPRPETAGTAIAEIPPRVLQVDRVQSASGAYARKANRIAVRAPDRRVVAIIEIVSPGNKDSRHAIRSFTAKAGEFLRHGVHMLVVDVFPPTARDPKGIHAAIWEELDDEPPQSLSDKPLTAVSYDAGDGVVGYVERFSVGDVLPEMPLFLEPGMYVPAPLEASYAASWAELPDELRCLDEGPCYNMAPNA